MLAFTRRLPQAAASCMRQVHAAPAALQAAGSPSYTGTVYKESEKARENAFFSKEDEKALRKLLTKVKTSADASCTTAGAHNKKEEEALHAIVGKHKLSDADMKALYAWRHSHDF